MKRNYNSTNPVATIKKLSGDSVLILLFLLVVFSVYNVDFLTVLAHTTNSKPSTTNDGIDKNEYPKEMEGTKEWLRVLNTLGLACLLFKIGWASAYKVE